MAAGIPLHIRICSGPPEAAGTDIAVGSGILGPQDTNTADIAGSGSMENTADIAAGRSRAAAAEALADCPASS